LRRNTSVERAGCGKMAPNSGWLKELELHYVAQEFSKKGLAINPKPEVMRYSGL
jgi:hypothetical protein